MVRSSEVQAAGTDAEVVWRATGADAHRLRATGERLLDAAHPGVVEVVSTTGSDDEWELRLVHGGRPIELVGPLTVEQVAGAASAVAAVLADLHRVGIVHGRIDGSHVLIGSHGRPVLCGLGEGSAAAPEDDVAAVGALIVALLSPEADLEPIPEHRWRRRAPFSGWARRSLLLVADQACAEPPSRRPSAARLATAIADAVPSAAAVAAPTGATSDQVADPHDQERAADPLDGLRADVDAAPRPVRFSALAASAVAVLLLTAGAVRLAHPGSSSPGAARPAVVSSTSSTTSAASTSSSRSTIDAAVADLQPTTVPTSPSVPCAASASAAPAPAGCGPITIDGSTVTVGDRRYEVGQPGDLVVAGDWDCDGLPTPALLRPSSGEVFVFPAWASDGDIVVQPVARVIDGEALMTDIGDSGCPTLVVRRADGTRQPVTAVSSA
jgi:hypothetical protein